MLTPLSPTQADFSFPASNLLYLPFRQSTPLTLSTAIKQYISSKYDQHPDMFTQDLQVIDALRTAAIQVVEPHASGIRKIAAYAGQLAWMSSKFPIDVRMCPSIRNISLTQK